MTRLLQMQRHHLQLLQRHLYQQYVQLQQQVQYVRQRSQHSENLQLQQHLQVAAVLLDVAAVLVEAT